MHWRTAASLAVILLLFPRFARAEPVSASNRTEAAKKVAQVVHSILREREVFVRDFRTPAGSDVGLSLAVGEELKKLGYQVQAGAKNELDGRLVRMPAEQAEPLNGFSVRASLLLSSGAERRFEVAVWDHDDGHITIGETGEVAPPPPAVRPANEWKNYPPLVQQPTIKGTRILPSPSSPYAVEILVETSPGKYEAREPKLVGGLVCVRLKRGEVYAVKLENGSPFEAAAQTRIDGLSRFALADDKSLRGGTDLVASRSERNIKGFYRDGKQVDSFLVGEYSKSVAAKSLPEPKEMGTITVSFAAAWKHGDQEPAYEPLKHVVGTAAGAPRPDPTSTVQRHVGILRAVIKVRYGEEF